MERIIKEELKKLKIRKNKTTNMEDENYYKGKIAGIKRAVSLMRLLCCAPKELASLKSLIESSAYLSNIAFNLKQRDNLPEEDKKLLDIWQKDWDKKQSECKPILDKIFGAA